MRRAWVRATMAGMYEVEVKSLLGGEERADALRIKMRELDPGLKLLAHTSQLNHYFEGGDLTALYESVSERYLSPEKRADLADIARTAKKFSVRTRQDDSGVSLVVKASVDDTTSENGIARREFDEKVELPLNALDAIVRGSGFRYQAKWSRDREEYALRDTHVCLDRNAGYGWVMEIEKMVEEEDAIPSARKELTAMLSELGAQELPQDRLERMFAFYNAHWEDYYGTDKVFTVE